MKKLLLILFLIYPFLLFAVDTLQSFHSIYFIAGDKTDQMKYQVSFRYALWFPYETGLYLGYTQLSKWNIYDRSSPFKETNYNPSIFYENIPNFEWFDFYRIGFYEHKSNGRDGAVSRSMDKGYGEIQFSHGRHFNYGIREKVSYYYSVSNKNADIDHYLGFFETEAFLQYFSPHTYIDHERLYIKGEWMHNRLNSRYWFEAGLSFRILTGKIQPNLYIQYYRGYAEFLEDYNKKTNALRAGFIFNN
jgi:phospholipase A1/A2